MSDPVPAPLTADENRLSAAVARIRQNIIDVQQFRPADQAMAAKFDQFNADMMQTLIETTQAAAVDQAAIILAKDISAAQRDFMLTAQKFRDQADVDNRAAGAVLVPKLLELAGST